MKTLVQKSKKLSYYLRQSLLPNKGGWVEKNLLIEKYNFTEDDLQMIVNNDSKGRYQFSTDNLSIRALYGHSRELDVHISDAVTPPPFLYHGTAEKYIKSILKEGLKSRSRKYVHLSEDTSTAKNVGSRHGKVVLLKVDTETMHNDGYEFYNPQTGIWQTTDIPPKYFEIIE